MRQLSAILLTNHGQFTDRLFQNSSQLSYHLLLLIYVPHLLSLFVFFYFLSTLSSPTLFVHPLSVAWPTMLCSPLSTVINSDSLVFCSKQMSCLGGHAHSVTLLPHWMSQGLIQWAAANSSWADTGTHLQSSVWLSTDGARGEDEEEIMMYKGIEESR